MSSLLYHLALAACCFAFTSLAATLASRRWLRARLSRVDHPARFDSGGIYAVLVAPGLLPPVLLGSAMIHLQESGALTRACCSLLSAAISGWHAWVLTTGILFVACAQVGALGRRRRSRHREHPRARSGCDAERRVRRAVGSHPRLRALADRIVAVECAAHVCAAVGVLRPRIEIAEGLVESLDDEALEAALLHEAAHVTARDPTRSAILLVSRIINPFSGLLAREASAWRFAREVACDSYAVDEGARPVSLADAIVTAARAGAARAPASLGRVALSGLPGDALRARVGLLIHDARCAPAPASGYWPAWVALLASAAAPHLLGDRLAAAHCLLEEALLLASSL